MEYDKLLLKYYCSQNLIDLCSKVSEQQLKNNKTYF